MKRECFGIVCVVALCAAVGWATDDANLLQRRHITVQGQGKVEAVPDLAVLTVGDNQEGPSLDNVSTQVREGMMKILRALKQEGVADKDIQTQAYSVQPKMAYDNKSGNSRRVGYRVSNAVEVKLHDLQKVGRVLTAVVNAGANVVDGPNFDFENPQQLERKALAAAMDDATAKARVLAEASKSALGAVLVVEQNGGVTLPFRRPRPMMAAMARDAAAAPEPVETGEQSFSATVNVTFALQ